MHIAPNTNLGLRSRTACRVLYNNMPELGTTNWRGPLPTANQLNILVRPNTGFQPGGQVYINGRPTLVYPGAPIAIQMER
jgi:hypothetical protein